MPIEIDGFAVLGAIARHPQAFPAVQPEAVKTAKAFVGKQLKDKGLGCDGLRAIAAAIGPDAFDLIGDGLSDAEVKALLAKVDKLNAEIKTAPAPAQRAHMAALARGHAAPAEKAAAVAKPVKAAPAPKPKVERSGNSKAMRAKKKV